MFCNVSGRPTVTVSGNMVYRFILINDEFGGSFFITQTVKVHWEDTVSNVRASIY